jgi:hypothetical protein
MDTTYVQKTTPKFQENCNGGQIKEHIWELDVLYAESSY